MPSAMLPNPYSCSCRDISYPYVSSLLMIARIHPSSVPFSICDGIIISPALIRLTAYYLAMQYSFDYIVIQSSMYVNIRIQIYLLGRSNHRKRQKAHSGIVSGRQGLGQARTLARRPRKKTSLFFMKEVFSTQIMQFYRKVYFCTA